MTTTHGNTKYRAPRWAIFAISGLVLAGISIAACSGGGSSAPTTPAMATASVMLSDPATCSGPTGPFAHVFVTITDVQANVSSSAGDGDSGWTDLTPSLSSQPKQVDLLGQANNQCFLATLGDAQQLQAGDYQQIRLILADNSATVANNACGNSTNCVILSADNSVHTLLLSSESKTGLKIPSGQIASGGFTIAAGQTKDLDIDFNTCASIVQEGNGQYRLKPVLHAGEVSTTSTSINGKVLDSATGNPVNGEVLVALEQKDATGVDRIMMSTLAGSDGSFVFCPIPTGTYDIVVVGEGASRRHGLSAIHRDGRRQRANYRLGKPSSAGRRSDGRGAVHGYYLFTERGKPGNLHGCAVECTRNNRRWDYLHHPVASQCPAALRYSLPGDSVIARLRSRRRLRDLCLDAAVRRTVSRPLLGEWGYIIAKLPPGKLCSGRTGVCSILRWNCRLRALGTEDAVVHAADIGRHHRGPNPCVCAVSIAFGQSAALLLSHDFYLSEGQRTVHRELPNAMR